MTQPEPIVPEPRPDGSMFFDIGEPARLRIPPGGPVPREHPTDIGYPDIILDQREGYSGLATDNPKDVATHWENFLARQRPPKPVINDPRAVVPYINQSRWVADCPNCAGGMLCWDQNPYTCCLDCGHKYSVDWQLPATRSEVIRLLAIRPTKNRNWDPRRVDKQGAMVETESFLRRENLLMHGKETM